MARIVALDDGRLIINPGSVGLPAYTDTEPVRHSMQMGAPHARYAVLERRKASEPWQVSFRVVAYDWDAAADARRRERARGLGALAQDGVCGLSHAPLIPAKAGDPVLAFANALGPARVRGRRADMTLPRPLASKIRTIAPNPRCFACAAA